MIRILIVDDHSIVRAGLKQILEDVDDMEVTGETENAEQTLELIHKQAFDIMVLDISLPGRDGIDLLKQIVKIKPELPVLVLTVHAESQYAVRTLKAGAWGFLNKESAPDELVNALRCIASGRRFISHAVAQVLARELGPSDYECPHRRLSDREHEVLLALAAGQSITEIGERLAISIKTVSTYRTRILQKMHMKSNAELIRYAIENKLLD